MIRPILELMVFPGFMIFCFFFMRYNQKRVDSSKFKEKYGAFMTNVETFKKHKAVYYTFIFMLRRLLLAITITLLGCNVVL